jgi:hypothetical protein
MSQQCAQNVDLASRYARWRRLFALHLCYKSQMPKIILKWLLFKYVDGEFTPLSKPFKTKAEAEKARLKLPEKERRGVAVGVIRFKK